MKTYIGRKLIALSLCLWMIGVTCGQEPQVAAASEREISDSILEIKPPTQIVTVKPNEELAEFTFILKNVGVNSLKIEKINTSCGCTTTNGITLPCILSPQSSISLPVTMNVVGKSGEVTKSVIIVSDQGFRTLLVTSIIPSISADATPEEARREQNRIATLTDRQAIFQGDCASCHTVPNEGKLGRELYQSACGICHEAIHRASMVPDLHSVAGENAKFWQELITHGRDGTLMPAFAKSEKGILDQNQIDSLVSYLTKEFTKEKSASK